MGSRLEHSHHVMVLPSSIFFVSVRCFKNSDIVYIDTFSCFLTLSVFDNLALKKGSKQANIEPASVSHLIPELCPLKIKN